ncbi:ATP-binding protein [Enterocloster clostridioformis]|nr:hypothetical protein A4V08_03015 [Lachnoclostridium sp. YL32]NDO27682.1 GHKL domain-containing protein [Enterocloster clostridioformis]OXE70146.1 ATP-binding protein [Enterocloster clostridioformis]QQR00289.1 GHKL domain-containing protein [Enterocloster clostridioformis]
MSVIFEVFELVASFIEVYILFMIYEEVLHGFRCVSSRRFDIYLAVIGAFITEFCNHISMFSYFTIFIFVLYVSISAVFLYRTNYVTLFSLASFYALCLSCFDFFVLTLISSLWNGDRTLTELISTVGVPRTLMLVAIKTLWVVAYLKLKKYLYNISVKVGQAYAVLAISAIGFLGFIYLVEQTFKAFDYTVTGIWLLVVVLFALLLFVIYFIIISREERMKLNFSEERNRLLEENYKAINEIYMNNAKLYHDLNNHLNVLYQMLDGGKGEKAKEYITEISKPIMKLSKTVWTGVDVVDVIINSKVEKMKEKGISYKFNVEFPQNTDITPHDMCTILANLLDNAIEAAGSMESPGRILLTIRRINHFIIMEVSNSYNKIEKNFIGYPKTTKQDKNLHGWGLRSVKDTVEKYNGSLKCITTDDVFTVRIILF